MSRVQKWATLAAVVVLLAWSPGCAARNARGRLSRQAAVFRAHASDQSLPRQAREVAQDAADYMAVEAWALGGDEPPADVLERTGGAK